MDIHEYTNLNRQPANFEEVWLRVYVYSLWRVIYIKAKAKVKKTGSGGKRAVKIVKRLPKEP